jgi:small-conductance mechanosensitive channel
MDILTLVINCALVLIGAWLVLRLSASVIDKLTHRGLIDQPYDSIVKAVSRWLIVILTALIILQLYGVPVSHVFATLSAVLVLVAVGFVAIWSVLSNILCAFLLLLSPPFSFGDEIELKEADKEKGFRGKVINLNLFYTTLQASINGKESPQTFRIPNTMFFQRVIICHEKSDIHDLNFGSIDSQSGVNTS